jgi:hypothetical protein
MVSYVVPPSLSLPLSNNSLYIMQRGLGQSGRSISQSAAVIDEEEEEEKQKMARVVLL